MNKKIDLNDSSAWQSLNWDEEEVHPDLKKSDATVNRSRSAFFKRDNPKFSETMSQVAIERNQDPEYVEAYQQGMATRDNSYQAVSNARPEVQAKIRASMSGKKKSDEHNAKVAAKNKERSKVIITSWGEFSSRKAAVAWAQQNTDIVNIDKKIQAWVKKPCSRFYYKEIMMKILEKATDILKDINADQLTTNAVIRDFDILTGINRSDAEEVKKIIGGIRTADDVTPEIINNLISLHRE